MTQNKPIFITFHWFHAFADDAFGRSSYSLRDFDEERDLRRFSFGKMLAEIGKIGKSKKKLLEESEE